MKYKIKYDGKFYVYKPYIGKFHVNENGLHITSDAKRGYFLANKNNTPLKIPVSIEIVHDENEDDVLDINEVRVALIESLRKNYRNTMYDLDNVGETEDDIFKYIYINCNQLHIDVDVVQEDEGDGEECCTECHCDDDCAEEEKEEIKLRDTSDLVAVLYDGDIMAFNKDLNCIEAFDTDDNDDFEDAYGFLIKKDEFHKTSIGVIESLIKNNIIDEYYMKTAETLLDSPNEMLIDPNHISIVEMRGKQKIFMFSGNICNVYNGIIVGSFIKESKTLFIPADDILEVTNILRQRYCGRVVSNVILDRPPVEMKLEKIL